jgi:2-dehydropantoate 2-reductase
MMNSQPRILILGAGAVGLSLAGRLSDVADVHVVCRKIHANVINERGLIMEGIWGSGIFRNISCFSEPGGKHPDFDYIFITSKGTDTATICTQYQNIIKDRPVISIQNGIGNEENIDTFTDKVIGGTVTTNFSIAGPGHVRVRSQSAPMKLGIFPTNEGFSNHPIIDRLIALIDEAGIPVIESPDIRSDIWAKSLLNIAVNPIGAILSVPVGASTDEYLWEIICGLIRETFAIIDAEGVTLPWTDAEEYLSYLREVQIPDFAKVFTSMYYDIEKGRQTEIGLLNGFIIDKGIQHGIPTPFNTCISNLIRYKQKQVMNK